MSPHCIVGRKGISTIVCSYFQSVVKVKNYGYSFQGPLSSVTAAEQDIRQKLYSFTVSLLIPFLSPKKKKKGKMPCTDTKA